MNFRTTNGAPNGAVSATATAAAPFPPVKPGGNGAARHAAAPATPRNGAANGAPAGARDAKGNPLDADTVIYRLEDAGQTLLAIPTTGYTTRLRTSSITIVRAALDGYGWENARNDESRLRPPAPDESRITRMDEALGWIPLIPRDKTVIRRIVGARSLVSPVTERHMFTWRRLGTLLGADHKAIQRWHTQGIAMILDALRK